MNFSIPDCVLGRQRCRQWIPLLTQQLRLRHLYQIILYNASSQYAGSFYYTLHLTTMCAPFYTSEKNCTLNPKWKELDTSCFPYPSTSAFVLRLWQTREDDLDRMILSWGIHLSGLTYLGVKLSEIQPELFGENTVIFHLRGGYFTDCDAICSVATRPLHFNIINSKVYRNIVVQSIKSEVKSSYTISKLQKLHLLQLSIKNESQDIENLREKIISKCGLCDNSDGVTEVTFKNDPSPVQSCTSQLLTMTTLNKMLQYQEKPTKIQRLQITQGLKQIEISKFRHKLLIQERDKKSALIRQLKQKYTTMLDENQERSSQLMENYHKLSRDKEKLKECRREQVQLKELLTHTNSQLHIRRQQLMKQLLFIYPIEQISERKFLISNLYLPDSDMLSDCSDSGLSIALGYVSHILVMCTSFLQVPLRYPITFCGSRSYISDHITSVLADKDRDFPLYAKGKDKMQFNYAVYLLNKNIAQLRWICGQYTPDLRATLLNLLTFLQGREGKDNFVARKSMETFVSSYSILATLKQERSQSPSKKKNESSEILAIPEAFMNQQITSNVFKSYATVDKFKQLTMTEDPKVHSKSNINCDTKIESIEQGTDILQSSLNLSKSNPVNIMDSTLATEDQSDRYLKQNRRISRSVGSINEEEGEDVSLELGSDPLLNISSDTNKSFSCKSVSLDDGQQEFLQKWLDSGPALVCSEENLYPDEILGATVSVAGSADNPLTLRTDALLNTTSFNLIKPK